MIGRLALLIILALALLLWPCTSQARDTGDSDPPTGPGAEQDEAESTSDDPPTENDKEQDAEEGGSLDDLLGLEESDDSGRAGDVAEQENDEELDRALNEQEIADAFRVAIEKMSVSAGLLSDQFDSGLGTQRIQEDIIKKLDDLINSAQQSSSSSSSSSSSQQQNQQNQQPRQQQQNQGDSQQQNQQSNQPLQGEATSVQNPPDNVVDIGSMLDEMRSEWGRLPDREREQLLQAMKDRPSVLYTRLTNDYFQRIADEASN